ncbi:TPA: site-specific integrase [Vibrio cholerae]
MSYFPIENCNGKFYCLLDKVTTMPPLLAFRWTEQELMEKSLATQKSYLTSLKLFYDFWLDKYGITLDYALHLKNFRDVDVLTQELMAFWDYLLADKQIANVIKLPSSNNSQKSLAKKKRTAAKHCQVICNFIQFLSGVYLTTAYRDEDPHQLRSLRTEIKLHLKDAKRKFAKWKKSNKEVPAYTTLRSMTSEQFEDFFRVLTPDVMKPVPVKLPDGGIQASFTLIKENPLNPIVSYDVQMRNYLLTTLLVRYGLRTGESLLLRKQSFLPLKSDSSKVIMRVRNLEEYDLNDSIMEDARHNKPQIKTADSVRDVEITAEDYKKIQVYFEFIRPKECEHDFIFASSLKPYKPVSYTTIQTQFKQVVESFKKHFPEHFDPQYAEYISETITPHWLRHTWAYAMLSAIYEKEKRRYIDYGVVNVRGIMEDAQDQLRVMGGWAKKSIMPAKYAKRFTQELANQTLMDVYRNHFNANSDIDFNKEEWDAAFS